MTFAHGGAASGGRIGLTPQITRFVVREDPSLTAQVKRGYGKASAGAGALAREAAGAVGATAKAARAALPPLPAIAWTPSWARPAEAEAPTEAAAPPATPFSIAPQAQPAPPQAPPLTVRMRRIARRWRRVFLRALRRLRASFEAGYARLPAMPTVPALAARARAALPGRERWRDAAFMARTALVAAARAFWRAPLWAKSAMAGFAALMMLYAAGPGEPADTGPEPAMELRLGDAASPARQDAEPPRPADGWKPVSRPISAYNLEAPELGRAAPALRVRAHVGGARQDFLAWDEPEPGKESGKARRAIVSGALSIERYPAATPVSETLLVDIARRAAILGASVERMGLPGALDTKFGTVETADARLLGAAGARPCLAFRFAQDGAPVQMHGWFCGTDARPVDRAALACLIDRIDLVSAGGDLELRTWFAVAERARQTCGALRGGAASAARTPAMEPPPMRGVGFVEPPRRTAGQG